MQARTPSERSTTLDDATLTALSEALDDEYKARATYRAVLDRFGEVRPFVNIIESEQQHIEALLRQFERHGIEPPGDRWAGTLAAPETIEEACRQAVQAERDNEAMYERLLESIEQPRIREVMRSPSICESPKCSTRTVPGPSWACSSAAKAG